MKTIYIDTSVFGGIYDSEFKFWTDLFFKKIIDSGIKIIFSDVAEDELTNAPDTVKEFVHSIPEKNLLRTELSEEAIILAEKYLEEKIVGQTSRADCYHIAMATILKADLLVSWNFKHIVNIKRIHGYNAINLINGYQTLEIRNPREVFEYEND
jgi:hypothetical protein